MSQVLLALGPMVFLDFELPAGVNIGGAQRLAVHRLGDGRRLVECLGRDDEDIRISGILTGPDATGRALVLDQLRSAGILLPLTWDVFFYTVVLREFTALYESDTWIPYRLRCTVVRDETEAPVLAVSSLAAIVNTDISAAASFAASSAGDLAPVEAAAAGGGAFTYGTDGFYALQTSLRQCESTISVQVSDCESQIDDSWAYETSSLQAVSSMSTQTQAAGRLATLVSMRGYIGRAAANLSIGSPR